MTKKQKQTSPKLASGLPVPPRIFINNSLGTSNRYPYALRSLIPGSRVHYLGQSQSPIHQASNPDAISIWAKISNDACATANLARESQVKALKQGCNFAFVALCNDDTFKKFMDVRGMDWPRNHLILNVDGIPIEEVSKTIIRWLFTVFSVRETLYLINEAEMLATDKKMFADYQYCSLQQARNQPKEAKLQFVALIASKPELTEPNKLTWKVVDRSGEANFYFYHRGPTSQLTWDWVLSLQVGDRKVLARMPMVALHEPLTKKILLSPLRATGTTIRGIGHVTMGAGKAVHWLGSKAGFRRQESDKYMAEEDYMAHMERQTARTTKKRAWKELVTTMKKKEQKKQRGEWNKGGGSVGDDKGEGHEVNGDEKEETTFKIFNEKGEKSWSHGQDDNASTSASTAAASLVDEKVEMEFC